MSASVLPFLVPSRWRSAKHGCLEASRARSQTLYPTVREGKSTGIFHSSKSYCVKVYLNKSKQGDEENMLCFL